jgi:hypothetical protein
MPTLSAPIIPALLRPGTVVSVWIFPFFRHRGIVSNQFYGNEPMVISNSARVGGIAEEPWDIFAADKVVYADGYPSNLPSVEVLRRARALIGKPYHVLRWNCEHLTSYAHGREPESPQLATMVILAVMVLMVGSVTAKSGSN